MCVTWAADWNMFVTSYNPGTVIWNTVAWEHAARGTHCTCALLLGTTARTHACCCTL